MSVSPGSPDLLRPDLQQPLQQPPDRMDPDQVAQHDPRELTLRFPHLQPVPGQPPATATEAETAAPQQPVSTPAAGEAVPSLLSIEDVQKALSRSRASVYRYTNTDPRNLNPPFHPRRLNPEYRSDQKDPLLFHPNEVARFARDVLRIKQVTVEVLNSPSTATQELLTAILGELQTIRRRLDQLDLQAERRSAA